MLTLQEKLRRKRAAPLHRDLFRNEEGAIDLASIMVGVLVIGLIGGVIAATVFAVIPWTQDNAAKQQMDSVVAAQSAYMGLSSTTPLSLPATVTGATGNSYGASVQLEQAGLLARGPHYCTVTTNGGKGYQAFSYSSSGSVWSASDGNTKPAIFTGTLPTECQFILTGQGYTVVPYVDPSPTTTTLTYNCPSAASGDIPMKSALTGTETWSDGPSYTYSNAAYANHPRVLSAGVNYTVTFTGTYQLMSMYLGGGYADTLQNCLRSVDHWGANTGVTSASQGFYNSSNLVSLPDHIPTTITDMSYMLRGASSLNDPNISKWDVSNVTDMTQLFLGNVKFNQPLNNWNVANVQKMGGMFQVAQIFNQDLTMWNVSNVTDMSHMFENASVYNMTLNGWDTSKVTNMSYMFNNAVAFNQPLDKLNTSLVSTTEGMFQTDYVFNQDVSGWNTSSLTTTYLMFNQAQAFNKPMNNFNVSNVTNMSSMFSSAYAFNQPLNNWNTSKVTDMSSLFFGAIAFNQNIGNWNTTNVTSLNRTFGSAFAFNQPLNSWNTSKVTNMNQVFVNDTAFNQPLDQWDTSKATTMFQTFYSASAFNQYIKGWNVALVTNSSGFRTNSALTTANSPF